NYLPASDIRSPHSALRRSRSPLNLLGMQLLLRTRRKRLHEGGAAEKRDELAPPHSITSSAVVRSDGATVMPSAWAVFRLITSSNLSGFWTGMSAGLAPFRMRST